MNSTPSVSKESKRILRLMGGEATGIAGLGIGFETIYQFAPLGIAQVDEHSRFLAANPALCRMLICAESEFLGKTVEAITLSEDQHRPGADLADRALSDQSTTAATERRLCRRDGNTIWASITLLTLPEFLGSKVSGLMVFEDITVRMEADRRRHVAEIALQAERSMLESKDTALREVLDQIDTHKRQSARHLQANVNRVIRPMLQILAAKLPPNDHHLVALLDSTLRDLLDPFVGKLESRASNLSRREMEVCHMIRNGFSSKQIASLLNVSVFTVNNQRRSIRRKLNIADGETCLESYLHGL